MERHRHRKENTGTAQRPAGPIAMGAVRRGLPFLTAAVALSVAVATSAYSPQLRPEPAPAGNAVHNLPPEACRYSLGVLMERSRGDARVLWVWTDETPRGGPIFRSPLPGSRSAAAPVPYAVDPNGADATPPAWACSFPLNSISVLSIGGVVHPGFPWYQLMPTTPH